MCRSPLIHVPPWKPLLGTNSMFGWVYMLGLGSWNVANTIRNNRFAECQNICPVHCIGHSAKKLFAECCINHTRQTKLFVVCWKKTTRQTMKKHSEEQRHWAKNCHVDIRQLVCLPLGVCRVSVSGTRQRSKFAECFPLALGKEIFLPSVFFGTR